MMPNRPEFPSLCFKALAENMPLALLLKDTSGKILFANKTYLEFSGRSLENIVGKSDYDFVSNTLASKYRAADAEVIKTGKAQSGFGRHKSKSGDILLVEHRRIPICDGDGNVIAIQFLFWDVTQQRDTETALAHERFLFSSLLEHSPDSIYFKDLQSNFTRISKSLAAKAGIETNQILGKTDARFFEEEHAMRTIKDEEQILETGESIVSKLEEEKYPDGSSIWCSTTKVLLQDKNGNVFGTFGISRDVTELMDSRRKLQKALALADGASRAKSEFVANMSHEIRTPMNGIIGMAKLLSETSLDSNQSEYASMISQASESLMGLLNDILDFSKIEAGKLELDQIPFNLSDSVGKTTQSLATKAIEKDLELACRISPALPERLIGDPSRLRQIILNLVGNAIKFTDHGEILVEVDSQKFDDKSVELHFSVKDTGIGIPDKKQELIFDEFSQADTSTTRRFGGTGLGLTICKQLVGLMGGKIWVESKVGVGTTFHFSAKFPVAENQPSTSTFKLESLRGIRTLVVDDNQTNRRIVEEMLKSWDLSPKVVDGGVAAITEMQNATKRGLPYQLVLLDCMMPGMDGFSVAELVSGNPVFSNPTIIMISSAAGLGDALRCKEAGISHYMTKPVIKSELFDVIVDALGTEHAKEEPAKLTEGKRMRDLKPARPLHILAVEDDEISQRVAVGYLERAGHHVTLAKTGREAISIVDALGDRNNESFDLILMDVQMPDIDGIKTTTVIREREKKTGNRIPIVAVTAAAMAGDRERCMDAGMDAYIAKPIQVELLLDTIEAQTGIARQLNSVPETESEFAANPENVHDDEVKLVDFENSRTKVPGGLNGLIKTQEIFLRECERLISELEAAFAQSDFEAIKRAVHTIRGSAKVLCADKLASVCHEMESHFDGDRLEQAQIMLPELLEVASKTNDEIISFIDRSSTTDS
ncbi:response regulator [Mariniblastus sp.]|nr:response regulator [Mariniblastus sp.]